MPYVLTPHAPKRLGVFRTGSLFLFSECCIHAAMAGRSGSGGALCGARL